MQDLQECGGGRFRLEGGSAGQQLVEDGAQGINVRWWADFLWAALLYTLSLTGYGWQTGWTPFWAWFRGRPAPRRRFKERGAYRWLRHPVYLAFLGQIWLTPTATLDRLMMMVLLTAYIAVGSCLKDRRLVFYLCDAYRAYLLKLNASVSFSTTIGTIFAERIIDVVVLFLLMLAATGLSFGRAVPTEVLVLMQVGLGLVVLVVIGLVSMRRLRPLIERLLPARFHSQYARFEHGTLNSFRGIPGLVVLTGVAWSGEVARLFLVTLSLGLGSIAPSVVVFVALASALMTSLPLTPAGLGFAEGAIVGILLLAQGAGLAPGVTDHAAASIALLDRGISYWSLIAVGLVVYPLSRRK